MVKCLTVVNQIGVGVVEAKQAKCVERRRATTMNTMVSMRDRSKNRKPLQKGRSLSIEAIQTVQALKRASKNSHSSLQQAFTANFRRLLKSDMIAVLRELLRQNQCLLALQVFEDMKEEERYCPKLSLYAEMVAALGSNGMLEQVHELIVELKAETTVSPDIQGFNALMESLMSLNLTGLAVECYYLMKSVSCDPDKLSFKILIDGLTSNGEIELSEAIEKDARGYYGPFWDLSEEEEAEMSYGSTW
ncbi:protein THYLAKOID ASSEMBLY 8, chloroplastic-like [Salvia splendens]|uniref:protein THYLAKOID ASSEMBLY 8, chloroplastic-like n=1 Tax=Salvia splendens TaxID=180675 RepID=UPI001103AD09|nr:protein THYLAKOID ASSEMBLY 8, chloroplastic-like [Salvia splendens]